MATYRLEIGKHLDLATGTEKPNLVMLINDEQFRLLTIFADMEKDENLDTTYVINKCRFKIYPVIEAIPKPTTQA